MGVTKETAGTQGVYTELGTPLAWSLQRKR